MKILIVQDDRKVASFLRRLFVEEGYAVDTCATGPEALSQALSGIYDLLILDWMLPELDGVEICRELRRRGSDVPILMLTARGEVRERVLCLNAGADDHLVRPFEVDELLARVNALLRRAGGLRPLQLGPLRIDRAARRVFLDGKPIELTQREFALLLHLAHRTGQVVTRSELLTQVWSTQFDPESNVVEVHVSRLRDKLGTHSWMIETVRGRGYRLSTERQSQ